MRKLPLHLQGLNMWQPGGGDGVASQATLDRVELELCRLFKAPSITAILSAPSIAKPTVRDFDY